MIGKQVRLGDLLIQEGLISEEQLTNALNSQKNSTKKKKLGEIIVDEGLATHKEVAVVLSKQLNIDFVDLYGEDINFKTLKKYNLSRMQAAQAIPFKEDEEFLHVATSDPLNYDALGAFEHTIITKPLKIYIALKEDIDHFFGRLEITSKTQSIAQEVKREMQSQGVKTEDESSAIMKLIFLIIQDAILRRSSDVHIEPDLKHMSVRVRVDGILVETFVFDLEVYNALSSRIKLLANLDISERRKPQDGHFRLNVQNQNYDFRLSTTPTMFGESIVMRILDQQKILLKLHQLGFENKNLDIFNEVIHSPYGIVLITGPTGSGKTTTLYAALNEVKSLGNKVMTIEDPVEYQLPLVQQVQVNEKVNFSFHEALRSFLRQDPDIILVGEIRDIETLNAAAQASLTGHLVFSTLHTNDAPSAIGRMVQMGLQSYLIADSMIAVIAQRLVRKICPHCKTEIKLHQNILKRLGNSIPQDSKFYTGHGCIKCNNTGYSGRILISEILRISEEIAKMIADGKSKYEIAHYAKEKEGFEPMVIDGISKALSGITSIEEVLRVTKE